MLIPKQLLFSITIIMFCFRKCCSHSHVVDEKRLHKYLSESYSWLVRPVANYSSRLDVVVRFTLHEILELNLKNQILATRIKIEHEWTDYKLHWDPTQYGGIDYVILPSEKIWLPDIFLWNSFGDPSVVKQASSVVQIHYDGRIKWTPVVILQSFCPMQILHYPFDIQICNLTFGSWTYDGFELLIGLKDLHPSSGSILMEGMRLDYYEENAEWNILSIPAEFNINYFACCKSPYYSIAFTITLQRNSLFYVTWLIVPLTGITYLSLLAFCLPAESKEKVTLCVSVLMSQVTFLLVMIDNIPVTSFSVPLLGQLIILDISTVGCSLLCTTIVLNIFYGNPNSCKMSKRTMKICRCFWLRRILLLRDFLIPEHKVDFSNNDKNDCHGFGDIQRANNANVVKYLCYIQQNTKRKRQLELELENRRMVAEFMDRIFLIVLNIAFIVGHAIILRRVPLIQSTKLDT